MRHKPLFVCLVLLGIRAIAQERSVTGSVRDGAGNPLVGASVVIKGTTRGSTSDSEGLFRLILPNGSTPTLTASIIGFVTQEVALTPAQTNVAIVLAEDNKSLDEVVVMGYGRQKKINLTGAVASIDAKEIENRPITNAIQALQGAFRVYW